MSEPLLIEKGTQLKLKEDTFKTCSTFFWLMLFFVTFSVLSLAMALFAYGPVFELEAGWEVWQTWDAFVAGIPLLGIPIAVFFPFVFTFNVRLNAKTILFVVTIPYVILVAVSVGFLIYDLLANCGASGAAAHCWNGVSVRWQYWWVFFSIIIHFIAVILQIVVAVQVLRYAREIIRIRAWSRTEVRTPGSVIDTNLNGTQVGAEIMQQAHEFGGVFTQLLLREAHRLTHETEMQKLH